MQPRIAIVHDALINSGGAERVVTYMSEAFPDAPIYTSVYLPDRTYPVFRQADIRSGPAQKWARDETRAKWLLPMWIYGFQTLDLREYDVVISSCAIVAKAVTVKKPTLHICYCHTPFALAWYPQFYLDQDGLSPLVRSIIPIVSSLLRTWDFRVAQRVHYFTTNSKGVARKILQAYGREATVIYGPVDLSCYQVSSEKGRYYLIVSRLNHYKRIDLAVTAFNKLGKPLVIIGDGPERQVLQRKAKSNITFLGQKSEELHEYYRNCKALIFPGEEHYGLVPLEAQASGRPVIAYRAGGVLETVIDNQTGIFFDHQTPGSLADAVTQFESMSFNPLAARRQAAMFDVAVFKKKLRKFVAEKVLEHQRLMC